MLLIIASISKILFRLLKLSLSFNNSILLAIGSTAFDKKSSFILIIFPKAFFRRISMKHSTWDGRKVISSFSFISDFVKVSVVLDPGVSSNTLFSLMEEIRSSKKVRAYSSRLSKYTWCKIVITWHALLRRTSAEVMDFRMRFTQSISSSSDRFLKVSQTPSSGFGCDSYSSAISRNFRVDCIAYSFISSIFSFKNSSACTISATVPSKIAFTLL
mmetsp:Transcript_4304/g.6377  ORF Transcript_4304/g.6377 Transcript_4304/m.6377 type:complete len:215 (+) Transcript_4304:176-820(+)